jgi:hypothetical protein
MLKLEIGDTIEPFFYRDYWIEERWYCDDCQQRMPEDERWQHPQTAFIHCINDSSRRLDDGSAGSLRSEVWASPGSRATTCM